MNSNTRLHILILALFATSLFVSSAIAFDREKDLSKLKPKSRRATSLQGPTAALLDSKTPITSGARAPGSVPAASDAMDVNEKTTDAPKSTNPVFDGGKVYPIRINEKL